MIAPQFTPGPWHLNGLAIESDDRYIGSCDTCGSNDEEMDTANAHLAAAAPAMYEALDGAKRVALYSGWPVSVDIGKRIAYGKILAALKKARGEQ